MHPAYVTEEVQYPLDNSLDDIDACAHSFHDICILDFLLPFCHATSFLQITSNEFVNVLFYAVSDVIAFVADVIAVSDDSEEYSDDRPFHRTRRAAAKQRVNYHEISNSDTVVSDSEHSSATAGHDTAVKSVKQSRRTKDSDSEYQPSSGAEDAGNSAVLSSQTASRCKRLGSSSDESGSEAVSKKKGRLNRIMSSSDYSSSDDENPRTDDDKSAAVNGECQELPVVNGQHQEDTDAVELNSASENNKGFTIANLLKTSDRTARSDNDSESSEQNDFSGEDSLSGIEDLVNYVTQS